MKLYRFSVLTLSLLLPMAAFADFQYQETTQVTGGSLMTMMHTLGHFSKAAKQIGEPVVSNVYVQGNKMARVDPHQIQIIDLDAGTITDVDLDKHTYTVMTFDQMRQAMEAAAQQMKAEQAKQQPQPPAQQPPSNVDVQFKVNVRSTGTTKQVSGVSANESILTLQMIGTDKTNGQQGAFAITADMWLTPEVPGYQEMRDFQMKLGQKLGSMFSNSGLPASFGSMYPGMQQGMSDMMKESSKLQGIPIEQITRMGATANGDPLPAASEAPLPPSNGPQMPSASDMAQQSATNVSNQAASDATSKLSSKMGGYGGSALSGFTSGFGGFGGFGHKKKQAPPPQETAAQNQQAADAAKTASVLLEMHTTMSGFSSASIDSSKFSVPSGFLQVQPQQVKTTQSAPSTE